MALSVSAQARRQLTNGLIAFSLGMLFFARAWYEVDHLQVRSLDYFRGGPGGPTLLEATAIASLLVTVAVWALWCLVERFSRPWLRRAAHVAFLLLLAYSIGAAGHYTVAMVAAVWMLEPILLVGAAMAAFGNTAILRRCRHVALVLVLLPSVGIDILHRSLNPETANAFAELKPAQRLPQHNAQSPRVVWVVFDEMDQPLSFEQRPEYLQLPELDRLRAESVSSSHAIETAIITVIALPSLISGRIFSDAQPQDALHLDVTFQGTRQSVDWRSLPNVFTQARTDGFNSALVGWHHPYCRILGDELVDCYSLPSAHVNEALAEETEATRIGVWRTVAKLFAGKATTFPYLLTGYGPSPTDMRDTLVQSTQQEKYFKIRDRAYRDAADPGIGLLLLHMPAPHMFPLYNRGEKSFHLTNSLNYFDNLALVDRTVGELRRAIHQAGLDSRTALLLTADHGFRPMNWIGRVGWDDEMERRTGRRPPLTVPFLLNLPGETQPVSVDKTFSNVASADLAMAVLTGEVATPPQAASWIERWTSQHDANEGPVRASATPANQRSVQ